MHTQNLAFESLILPHRGALRRIVGPTRAAASDRRYTVTVSTRR